MPELEVLLPVDDASPDDWLGGGPGGGPPGPAPWRPALSLPSDERLPSRLVRSDVISDAVTVELDVSPAEVVPVVLTAAVAPVLVVESVDCRLVR